MRLIGYDSSDNFGPYVNSETSVNFLTAKKLVRENLNKDSWIATLNLKKHGAK